MYHFYILRGPGDLSLTCVLLFILSAFWFIIKSSDHIHPHSYRVAHILCFVLLHLGVVLKIALEYSRARLLSYCCSAPML